MCEQLKIAEHLLLVGVFRRSRNLGIINGPDWSVEPFVSRDYPGYCRKNKDSANDDNGVV